MSPGLAGKHHQHVVVDTRVRTVPAVLLQHQPRLGNVTQTVNQINSLQFRGNYSATSNNMKLVTLAVNGWAVRFGTARRELVGAATRPGPSSLY